MSCVGRKNGIYFVVHAFVHPFPIQACTHTHTWLSSLLSLHRSLFPVIFQTADALSHICSRPAPPVSSFVLSLQSVDLSTVQKSDLAFTAPFEIHATRNDYIHALVIYFTIDFTQTHKPISFSTAPDAKYTHWKQTVVCMHTCMCMCAFVGWDWQMVEMQCFCTSYLT